MTEAENNSGGTSNGAAVQEGKSIHLTHRSTLAGHARSISSLKYSPDGKYLASSSSDKSVKIWAAGRDELVATLEGEHTKGISDVCWSPDSLHVASASDDTNVIIWNIETKGMVRMLKGHSNYVFCVCFSPTGSLLASGSFDESIRIWDVRHGSCLRTLPAHSDPITAVHFSPDGTLLLSGSYDGIIRIWDTSTGQCLKTLIDDDNPPVSFTRFSPNGKYVLAGTLDSTVRLWSYATGRCLKSYLGHVNTKYCCFSGFLMRTAGGASNQLHNTAAPSPSAANNSSGSGSRPVMGDVYIVSGSEDGKVFIWDLASKRVVLECQTHQGPTMALAISPDNEYIAVASLEPEMEIKIFSVHS